MATNSQPLGIWPEHAARAPARRVPGTARMMVRLMFEYAALVDAPVQRFTGIVTRPDPDEVPTLAERFDVVPPAAPRTTPGGIAPTAPVAPSQPIEVRPSITPQPPITVVTDRGLGPSAAKTAAVTRRPAPASMVRTRPHQPAVLPAAAAIAAVALSAFWLLRRGPHGRAR